MGGKDTGISGFSLNQNFQDFGIARIMTASSMFRIKSGKFNKSA